MTPQHATAQTTNGAANAEPTSALAAHQGDVTSERIRRERSGDDWLLKGGNYYQNQFSPLKAINDKNVAKLGLAHGRSISTTRWD